MEDMYITYAIKNEIDEIYIGYTVNIEKRVKRHNGKISSKSKSYTHKHRNGKWILVLTEEFETRREAMIREQQLKSYRGRQYIRDIIEKQKTGR